MSNPRFYTLRSGKSRSPPQREQPDFDPLEFNNIDAARRGIVHQMEREYRLRSTTVNINASDSVANNRSTQEPNASTKKKQCFYPKDKCFNVCL